MRQPAFLAPAATTLALGIAAAAAIFALVDSAILRPLPYPSPERLVAIKSSVPGIQHGETWGLAAHELYYFRESATALLGLGAYTQSDLTVRTSESTHASRSHAAMVSAGMFPLLGIRPVIGRLITPADNAAPGLSVALLGNGFWQREYGGSPDVVGRKIEIEGMPVVIAGVVAAGASLPGTNVDLWLPLSIDSTAPPINQHNLSVIGRMRDGASIDEVESQLDQLTARLPELFPSVYTPSFWQTSGFTTVALSLRRDVVGGANESALWIILAAVGLLLCIAIANTASLVLVRLEARRVELTIRSALGLDRRRLAAELLSESAVICFAAAVVAGPLAFTLLRLVIRFAPSSLPRIHDGGMLPPMLLFLAVAWIGCTLVLGMLPLATHLHTAADAAVLREGGRGLRQPAGRQRVRQVLVAGQIALSLVLLSSAGLLIRSYERLGRVRPGFRTDSVLTAAIMPPIFKYQRPDAIASLYESIVRQINEIPGVVISGVGQFLPLDPTQKGGWCQVIHPDGLGEGNQPPCVAAMQVSPGYLEALGIPVHGHAPDWSDTDGGNAGLVVSRSLASRLWPGSDPTMHGARPFFSKPPYYPVEGIADDIQGAGLDQAPTQAAYFPLRARTGVPLWSPQSMSIVIRYRGVTPSALTRSINDAINRIDPAIAVTHVQRIDSIIDRSVARRTFTMTLLSLAALIAALLSVVGLYGLVAYFVGQRRSEIGIRLALGASTGAIARLVMSHSMKLIAGGAIVGICGTLMVSRVLASMLFEIGPTDATTLLLVTLLLMAVSGLASLAPTLRATSVNPSDALRSE